MAGRFCSTSRESSVGAKPALYTCARPTVRPPSSSARGTRSGSILGTRDLHPIGWTADGRFLFAQVIGSFPARVVRVEVATGKRERWKDLAPSERMGVDSSSQVFLTPDGKSYVYMYTRMAISDLFVVEGLK